MTITGLPITRWRARRTGPARDGSRTAGESILGTETYQKGYDATYMTPQEHLLEADRLAWVADDVIQSGAKRTLGDLIALARLHLQLAEAGADLPLDGSRDN